MPVIVVASSQLHHVRGHDPKARNEVLIHIPGHARRRRLTVLNTKTEHDRLVALLAELDRPAARQSGCV